MSKEKSEMGREYQVGGATRVKACRLVCWRNQIRTCGG